MARKASTGELILEALVIAQTSGCSFEQLVSACPGLTWNQIFLEVDWLSRDSLVQLTHDKPGIYCIRLPKPSTSTATVAGRLPMESEESVVC